MKNFLAFTLIFSIYFAYSQKWEPDILQTELGQVEIFPVLHGTLVLKWNKLSIYVDPYGGKEVFDGLDDPNIILITDIHGDHHNANTLSELNLEIAIIIAPQAVHDKLTPEEQDKAKVLSNDERFDYDDLWIEAIPMYNLPEDETSRHTKGRGNGYVMNFGKESIYISGDTEDIVEMRNLKNIDVAFVCMNQPYTMTVEQAADAVLEFKPKVVYPFHYRGGGGKFSNVEKFKSLVNNGNPDIEVRLRAWYPEGQSK